MHFWEQTFCFWSAIFKINDCSGMLQLFLSLGISTELTVTCSPAPTVLGIPPLYTAVISGLGGSGTSITVLSSRPMLLPGSDL